MKQALKDADLSAAMQQEYDALIKQHTSDLAPLLFNGQPIRCKWLDVNIAFLNGFLEETDYMVQPPGFEVEDKSLVCKLNKALYGLKQAPLYHNKTSICIFLKIRGQLDYFLGLEVKYMSDSSLIMTQTKYIRDLLSKTNMIEAHPIYSPMVSNCKVSKHGVDLFSDPTIYRSVVSALHMSTITRPEISFSVNKVCQFMASPLESHWTIVKNVLWYLKGTIFHGLHFQVASPHYSFSLKAYCDVDWASDVDDRRSTYRATIFPCPNLISWWSRKQQVVACLSTEAEYRSLA
ncbi:hypothetical protein V8G54_036500 [Vigna mungo]|uniref:Reverse transcriptase Ty1/copia-type domain-containing protein n=1 Tax=Vigna mungo TaxID=3915 RepID=A0AAQ3REI4_VIGMU